MGASLSSVISAILIEHTLRVDDSHVFQHPIPNSQIYTIRYLDLQFFRTCSRQSGVSTLSILYSSKPYDSGRFINYVSFHSHHTKKYILSFIHLQYAISLWFKQMSLNAYPLWLLAYYAYELSVSCTSCCV